jgi:apolipoprotein N-acyltransferase
LWSLQEVELPDRRSPGAKGVLDSPLPFAIKPTIYARLGDIPAAIIVAAALLIVIRRRAAKAV